MHRCAAEGGNHQTEIVRPATRAPASGGGQRDRQRRDPIGGPAGSAASAAMTVQVAASGLGAVGSGLV